MIHFPPSYNCYKPNYCEYVLHICDFQNCAPFCVPQRCLHLVIWRNFVTRWLTTSVCCLLIVVSVPNPRCCFLFSYKLKSCSTNALKIYQSAHVYYFYHTYMRSCNTQKKYVPLELFPDQIELINDYDNYNENITRKYRQAGVSTVTAAWLSKKIQTASPDNPERILIIANKRDTAIEMANKIRGFLDQWPEWINVGFSPDNNIGNILLTAWLISLIFFFLGYKKWFVFLRAPFNASDSIFSFKNISSSLSLWICFVNS